MVCYVTSEKESSKIIEIKYFSIYSNKTMTFRFYFNTFAI